ncbi:PREDICTED: dimethylaniline monooxygenase [N-oxide-forming] 5-like [Branchiostoma belcheri]|uniref:Flavin-containing monooxygenase n=1 Tax=Branchiostoma belcheri TaxID=7741 RepID=A0A6P5AFC2_BRABE|nr:PREDICTED: dimethylaniline monooxygenase [N-oxide-forming] 5-like [Branchiostoma belcheri]
MAATSETDVVVIGAGISGVVTAKCLLDVGLKVKVLERTGEVGGLWTFRDKVGYGVMRCTHINVSKHNYCFSDFPFPDDVPDYPHHSHMAKYITDYVMHFGINNVISFQTQVNKIERKDDKWVVTATRVEDDGKGGWSTGEEEVYVAKCRKVYLSTRSGAWVLPNYVFGRPTDHYACRTFLWLPWKLATNVLETVVTLIHGSPYRWGLNPKMRALQTQPTVSPTLIHNIQRNNVTIKPNITRFEGSTVHFTDGSSAVVDHVVMCTGFRVSLPFLPDDVKEKVLEEGSNSIKLYKNVFCPDVGSSLAFIGFVQPASGGILSMSETQARWFAELCLNHVKLPNRAAMEADIRDDEERTAKRYFASARHTIQKDPLLYNDSIAAQFGAKPQIWRHPRLAWRLLLGSCGAAQWRLQGPGRWDRAAEVVRSVPVTEFILYSAILVLVLLLLLLTYLGYVVSRLA